MTIPFSSIIIGERYRKDYGDLSGLKESLRTVGSIHPIVLSRKPLGPRHSDDPKIEYVGGDVSLWWFDLVAGGRRYAAMKELGITELHEGSVLEPTKLGFNFKENVPLDELREAELDENLHRLTSKWQEDVMAIADVHELKRRKHGFSKWGYRQTAEVFKGGFGEMSVLFAIRIAKELKKGNAAVAAATSISDAYAVLIKNKEDEALAELQKRVTPKVGVTLTRPMFTDFPSLILPSGNESIATPQDKIVMQNEGKTYVYTSGPVTATEKVQVPLSSMFRNAKMENVEWPKVDHVVTDIPYAIETDNMDTMKSISDVADTHDVDDNLRLMPIFLEKAFDAIKPGGFCVFFFDLVHFEKLLTWSTDIGFRAQRWPYLACKTSACRNSAAQYNTTKNYEAAMFLRKDSNTVLRKAITSSYHEYDFAAERSLYNNPFAKPFLLWKFIYDAIAFPGQSVLDPYCGEMSACRAAANCGLVPHGIELSEQHYNRGLQHMRAVYALIHKSNVEFV